MNPNEYFNNFCVLYFSDLSNLHLIPNPEEISPDRLKLYRKTQDVIAQNLTRQQKFVIKAIFYEEWTQDRLAKRLHCSQSQISRILESALDIVKNELEKLKVKF